MPKMEVDEAELNMQMGEAFGNLLTGMASTQPREVAQTKRKPLGVFPTFEKLCQC